MSVLLEIKALVCGYNGQAILDGLSLHAKRGSLVCLLGPSGCGKTTLLRTIAGFEPVMHGKISLDGQVVSRPGFTLPPERRRVGMVFQENTLFPHLSVAGNIGFGVARGNGVSRRSVVHELLDVVGLQGLGGRFVHELSGGQQQRVALARALAPNPEMMLLDEPFSSLDIDLRERLGQEVREIVKARGITTLLVTHDQNEAFSLGDRIGVMHEGRITQLDTAFNLYHEPVDRFTADFIGQGVLLRGTLRTPDSVDTELGVIRGNRAYTWPTGSDVDVLLRPDDVLPDPDSPMVATVLSRAFKGAEILYVLKLPTGSSVLSLFPSHLDHAVGEPVGIRVSADHLVAFPAFQSLPSA